MDNYKWASSMLVRGPVCLQQNAIAIAAAAPAFVSAPRQRKGAAVMSHKYVLLATDGHDSRRRLAITPWIGLHQRISPPLSEALKFLTSLLSFPRRPPMEALSPRGQELPKYSQALIERFDLSVLFGLQ